MERLTLPLSMVEFFCARTGLAETDLFCWYRVEDDSLHVFVRTAALLSDPEGHYLPENLSDCGRRVQKLGRWIGELKSAGKLNTWLEAKAAMLNAPDMAA